VRRLLIILFIVIFVPALLLSLVDANHAVTRPLQMVAVVLAALLLLNWLLGMFLSGRNRRPPRSQVAELERLYFRAMRDMLNDHPNLPQVINDLRRILSIDPGYKNARHYLNRAQILQAQEASDPSSAVTAVQNRASFIKLQEKLIDGDPDVRKSVVMELIQYGEIATDPLIALLMDEDEDVRIHAATALGWVAGEDAIQPLLVALQDENPYVRRYAARALCWVVDESAVEALIAALNDEDTYVRCYSARALGWSGDKRAIRPLIELLVVENADVREYALTALDDLGEKDVRPPMKVEPV
jgi:bilin biosynthesis protein